jgi:hypothetical protein
MNLPICQQAIHELAILSASHFINRWFCHFVNLPLHQHGIIVNLTFHELAILSVFHFINWQFWHFVSLPFHQLGILLV